MNFNVLADLKQIENDHELSILVIDDALSIPIEDLVQLSSFGKVTIAVENTIEAGYLIGKLSGLKCTVVLNRRIPIMNYDVLISSSFSDVTRIIVKNLKIKYLCFTKFVRNFDLKNYYEFEENSYRLTSKDPVQMHHPHHPRPQPSCPPPSQDEETEENEDVVENDASNYDTIIKDISSTLMKYDKYRINYLNPVVPGKISIIMIVSELNNNFAEVIRAIKDQKLPSIEFIIIDNAAGFRNNVKPNIRYGEKMPQDFCEYHAKELTTGEYIIIMNQDSEVIDVMTAINLGQFETR